MHVSVLSELDDSHKETEAIFEGTMTGTFLKLIKDMDPQIQEAKQTQIRCIQRKSHWVTLQ